MKFGALPGIFYVILIAFGSFFHPMNSYAQTSIKVFAIEKALENDDFASAGTLIREIWQEDAAHLYLLGELATRYFRPENGFSNRGDLRADSLLHIIESGIANDPIAGSDWLIQRFLLIRSAPQFQSKTRIWAFEAILKNPLASYCMIYEEWSNAALEAYQNKEISLQSHLLEWRVIDQGLLLKEINGRSDAQKAALLRKSIRHKTRNAIPDCGETQIAFSKGRFDRQSDQDEVAAFLIHADLQDCRDSIDWKTAFEAENAKRWPAWVLRLGAAKVESEGHTGFAIQLLEMAIEKEEISELNALDELQIGRIYAYSEAYTSARKYFQSAINHLPNWGEPYLQLIKLYENNSDFCSGTEFDKKAINWLLLELCAKMGQADANYSEQAANLSFRYMRLAPTAEEAAFHGLADGDSWPLKCWMQMTVRVRIL